MERLKRPNNIKIDDSVENIKQKTLREVLDYLKDNEAVSQKIQEIFQMKNGIDKNIIYEYLTYVYSYIKDIQFCANCCGLEKCGKQLPFYRHYNFSLLFDGKFVYKSLLPCKLKQEEINLNLPYIFKNLIYFGPFRDFPSNLLSLKLKDLDLTKEIEKLLERYKSSIKRQNISKWYFIYGPVSSGTTYVSVAILNNTLKIYPNASAAFLDFPKRVGQLQDLFFTDRQEFEKITSLYSKVDILVLDNFGDEYKTEFIRDTILYPLLLSRTQKNLITIINSRFNYNEISSMYSFKDKIHSKGIKELLSKFCGEMCDISNCPNKIYI